MNKLDKTMGTVQKLNNGCPKKHAISDRYSMLERPVCIGTNLLSISQYKYPGNFCPIAKDTIDYSQRLYPSVSSSTAVTVKRSRGKSHNTSSACISHTHYRSRRKRICLMKYCRKRYSPPHTGYIYKLIYICSKSTSVIFKLLKYNYIKYENKRREFSMCVSAIILIDLMQISQQQILFK